MPGKPGRPRSTSREEIVRAALDDGLDRFSMPSVARRIGIAHSALYRYVTDREDLLIAAIEEALSTVTWPSPDQPWEDLLRDIGDTAWDLCERYPGFDRATISTTRVSMVWVERFSEYVEALNRQGFSLDDATVTVDFVIRLALFGSLEMQRQKDIPEHLGGTEFEQAALRSIEIAEGRGWYDRQLSIILAGAAPLRTT